jgi:hypothetical protein
MPLPFIAEVFGLPLAEVRFVCTVFQVLLLAGRPRGTTFLAIAGLAWAWAAAEGAAVSAILR